jgi:hypothetical protein
VPAQRASANDERFAMVAKMFEAFERRFQTQERAHAKVETQVTEIITYKRTSEKLFRALKMELNELPAYGANGAADEEERFIGRAVLNNDLATNFTDKHEKLEDKLMKLELELKERLEDVDTRLMIASEANQTGVISQYQNEWADITAGTGGGNHDDRIEKLEADMVRSNMPVRRMHHSLLDSLSLRNTSKSCARTRSKSNSLMTPQTRTPCTECTQSSRRC